MKLIKSLNIIVQIIIIFYTILLYVYYINYNIIVRESLEINTTP